MNIENIAKKYIDLTIQTSISENDKKELSQCKNDLELWSSMGNKDLKVIFECIIEHKKPCNMSTDLIDKNEFPTEIKRIVTEIFYDYLDTNKDLFEINEKILDEWYDLLKKFSIDDDEINQESDDYILKEYISSHKTLMYRYILDNHFSNEFLQNKLIILKGWSSATPIINSYFRSDYCYGGGFYININGTGIVIDPGCNFIKSMHEQGIRIFDINYIIITHNHIDHNASMLELQNLNYEYNNFIVKEKNNSLRRKKLPNNCPNKITWIVDKETKQVIDGNKDFNSLIRTLDGNSFPINEIIVCDLKLDDSEIEPHHKASKNFLNRCNTYNISFGNKKNIRVTCFRTYHMKGSFGFTLHTEIEDKPVSIGYTSDTGYFRKLPQLLDGCNIIIENISELSKDDLVIGKVQNDANHLKLNGSIKTIKEMKKSPRIAIISEFWGGKDDIRLFIIKRICEGIAKSSKLDDRMENEPTKVLAADIGLTLNIIDYTIKCSSCCKEVHANKIITVQNNKYGQLKYICEKCSNRN